MGNQQPLDELIEKCSHHDRVAQHELYQRYSEAMFHLCLRLMPSQPDAEDVLQEAFLKAFRNIKQFKGNSTFGAWLKRIVVNQCMDQLRKDKNRMWVSRESEFPEEVPIATHKDQALIQSINVDMVKEAIKSLPEGFKMVLTLFLIEGYDHQEIGDILGISPSTSKSQYSRAKAKLREILNGYTAIA